MIRFGSLFKICLLLRITGENNQQTQLQDVKIKMSGLEKILKTLEEERATSLQKLMMTIRLSIAKRISVTNHRVLSM